MTRRIEIQPAPHRMARVETWLDGRCTGISHAMSYTSALVQAETMAGSTVEIVDHTPWEV